MKGIKKLKADIKKKIDAWNERSQFTLAGVRNLSRADMDLLDWYADVYLQEGSVSSLMPLRGEKGLVWEKYLQK